MFFVLEIGSGPVHLLDASTDGKRTTQQARNLVRDLGDRVTQFWFLSEVRLASSRRHTVALARRRQAPPSIAPRSDGGRELGERSREPKPRVNVGGKFVVAAANVLDKGMAGADHPY